MFPMNATRFIFGTISRSRARRLPAISGDWSERPVMLPPGLARLATRPLPTGSAAVAKTIGMTAVACLSAMTTEVPDVTMISTLSPMNSVAISLLRSLRPSAQRYSMATVRFSIQPSSRSRCTKAATRGPNVAYVAEPRKPIVGSLPGLLRVRGKRHRRRAADERDELAPLHVPQGPVAVKPSTQQLGKVPQTVFDDLKRYSHPMSVQGH